MGIKKLSVILISLMLLATVAGCSDKPKNTTIEDFYTSTKNTDNHYNYTFEDKNGKVLFEKADTTKEPEIREVSAGVYELITQTGTGLSTNWAVYCDTDNSKVSETFTYVLGARDSYVIYVDYENKEHTITVQNIFDKSAYCETYKLENESAVAADIVVAMEFNDQDDFVVTYLSGEDFTKTDLTIDIP